MFNIKKGKTKIESIIIFFTFIIGIVLSFFATPNAFNGFFMNGFWDDIRFLLFCVLIFELAILGVKSFSIKQRILIWAFLLLIGLSRTFFSHRLTTVIVLLWASIAVYVLIKENKRKKFPLNRLTIMVFSGIFIILSNALDIQMINEFAFLLIAGILGPVAGILGFLFLQKQKIFKKSRKNQWLLPLQAAVIGPFLFYMLLIVTNYSLDLSMPITYEFEIIDLEVTGGHYELTKYNVFFELNGETFQMGFHKGITIPIKWVTLLR